MSSTQATTQAPLFDLPDFENISASDIEPRTEAMLRELSDAWQVLTAAPEYTFEGLVHGHQTILHELSRRWSPISHLNMVSSSDEWQSAYLDALAKVTEFSSRLSQDRGLFLGYQQVAEHLPADADAQQKQVISHALRDFRLAGIDLDDDGQSQYRDIAQRLSTLQATFANHVQACSDQWEWHTTDETEISGLPTDVRKHAKRSAEAAQRKGWLFDLSQPTYQAVMTHANHAATRQRFYLAWMTRAAVSDQHDPAYDNSALIIEILSARQELAELLGFDHYADYSLAPKMAGSVNEVLSFLSDLGQRSQATAKQELEALTDFAGHELNAWDVSYYLERYKESRFSISDEKLRPYFPAERVLDGVFDLAKRLYGLTLEEATDVSDWHPDVRFFTVREASGNVIGGFYADLYARHGKRGGAWIDECVIRSSLADDVTLPVGYLVCNFSPADGDTPSLLSHNDVVTLFHEFGHMLHHLLTRVDYPTIAGINGVPWDAVELPSQFMENFAWHYDVLAGCSGHFETGDPLPQSMFELLLSARNVGAGLQMLRQLEFATFDFTLHAETGVDHTQHVQRIINTVREETSLVPVPQETRFENSFTHIFAGGYAAGYYSYKWAEVLAADAFSAFNESGDIFDQSIASAFREHILEVGGSRDIHDAFVSFRGRPARIDALLESAGIVAA
ncbi:MAG: M3 family metallopeptidase [Pseudomonadota bacterium]